MNYKSDNAAGLLSRRRIAEWRSSIWVMTHTAGNVSMKPYLGFFLFNSNFTIVFL